ncbi:UNVERIFIED_CONTAM: hypothetical protein NCL1_12046 [Trichonephila clavipes]
MSHNVKHLKYQQKLLECNVPKKKRINIVLSSKTICQRFSFNLESDILMFFRDTEETVDLLKEMKEFMPCESNDKLFADEHITKWTKDRRKSVCKFAEDWICYCGSNLG